MAAHLRTEVIDPVQEHGALAWAVRPDIYLQIWVLAWDVHALGTQPGSLFDANIFYPSPLSLTTHDHMLGALPIYLPLAMFSGNPIFAHQGTLLLTFACAFLSMLALVWHWTHDWSAAVLAGALFAFSPFRAQYLGALNLEGNYYLPLIALFAQRTTRDASKVWPSLLVLALVMQALHSYQVGYAAFLSAGILCATACALNRSVRRRWVRLFCGLIIGGLFAALSAAPYVMAKRIGVVHDVTLEFLRMSSGQPGNFDVQTFTLALVALAAVFWRRGLQSDIPGAWPLALVVVAVTTHLLALGPVITVAGAEWRGPWWLLSSVVPGFAAVRVPSRFNSVATMALSAVAGVGAAGTMQWLQALAPSQFRWMRSLPRVAAIALAIWAVQSFMGGEAIALRPIENRETIPPVYRWLAQHPGGAVIELPLRDWEVFSFDGEVEALRVYRSTYHWHPIANGYSGHTPGIYHLLAAMAARLPEPDAIQNLARFAGIHYVIVNEQGVSAEQRAQWRATDLWRQTLGDQTLYVLPDVHIDGAVPLSRPVEQWRGLTPGGVALEQLNADGQQAALSEAMLPAYIVPAFPQEGSVRLENRGPKSWPGIAPPGTHGAVALEGRFLNSAGQPLSGAATRVPLGVDVEPGANLRVPLWFWAPAYPGKYSLQISLVQEGNGPFDPSLGGRIDIPLEVRPSPWARH
jgi:hypothetical protein